MFDAEGKAWLLELNCSPSLAIDSVRCVNDKAVSIALPQGLLPTRTMRWAVARVCVCVCVCVCLCVCVSVWM